MFAERFSVFMWFPWVLVVFSLTMILNGLLPMSLYLLQWLRYQTYIYLTHNRTNSACNHSEKPSQRRTQKSCRDSLGRLFPLILYWVVSFPEFDERLSHFDFVMQCLHFSGQCRVQLLFHLCVSRYPRRWCSSLLTFWLSCKSCFTIISDLLAKEQWREKF